MTEANKKQSFGSHPKYYGTSKVCFVRTSFSVPVTIISSTPCFDTFYLKKSECFNMLLYFYCMIYFCICTHILQDQCTVDSFYFPVHELSDCAIEQERTVFNLLCLHVWDFFFFGMLCCCRQESGRYIFLIYFGLTLYIP